MSESRKALEAVRLSARDEANLPDNPLWRNSRREQKQRERRNVQIYKEWLRRGDECLPELSERWCLSVGRLRGICTRLHGDGAYVPVEMRAELDAIRDVKRQQILDHVDEAVTELKVQIEELERRRADGEQRVEVEYIERDGDKAHVTRKSVPIDVEINGLNEKVLDLEAKAGRALEQYMGKPATEATHRHLHELRLSADEGFRAAFDRLQGVEADYEVIDEGADPVDDSSSV